MSTCNHIFTKGRRKGHQCQTKPRNGFYCAKHKNCKRVVRNDPPVQQINEEKVEIINQKFWEVIEIDDDLFEENKEEENEENEEGEEEKEKCSICYEECATVSLPCGHNMCMLCITCLTRDRCPFCRKEFRLNDIVVTNSQRTEGIKIMAVHQKEEMKKVISECDYRLDEWDKEEKQLLTKFKENQQKKLDEFRQKLKQEYATRLEVGKLNRDNTCYLLQQYAQATVQKHNHQKGRLLEISVYNDI